MDGWIHSQIDDWKTSCLRRLLLVGGGRMILHFLITFYLRLSIFWICIKSTFLSRLFSDNLWAVMIFLRIRGKIVRTVLHSIVHSHKHTCLFSLLLNPRDPSITTRLRFANKFSRLPSRTKNIRIYFPCSVLLSIIQPSSILESCSFS